MLPAELTGKYNRAIYIQSYRKNKAITESVVFKNIKMEIANELG